MKIELGQKVRYTSTIERKSEFRQISEMNPHKKEFKFWKETGFYGTGIVIGQRTLSDGRNDYDPDAGNMYEAQSHFVAYLVAYNLMRKPLIVKKENIVLLNKGK